MEYLDYYDETALGKYGSVLDKVIEITNNNK